MTITIILSMIALSFAMSISPGPVNILIISSAVNHGFKKTFAFVSGATIGFTLLLVCVAFGLIVFIEDNRLFLQVLSIVGAFFIIYLGYKIASSKDSIKIDKQKTKTLNFYEGFLLQWLNPKAWIACVASVPLFSSTKQELITFIIIYFILCYLSLLFRALFSEKLSIFLDNNKKLTIFNFTMGGLLIIPAIYLIISFLI